MNTLQKLSRQIGRLQVRHAIEKERVKQENQVGRHDGFTIYTVKSTRIKAHRRRSFRAVRVKR